MPAKAEEPLLSPLAAACAAAGSAAASRQRWGCGKPVPPRASALCPHPKTEECRGTLLGWEWAAPHCQFISKLLGMHWPGPTNTWPAGPGTCPGVCVGQTQFPLTVFWVPQRSGLSRRTHVPRDMRRTGGCLATAEDACAGEATAQKGLRDVHI